jgi:hypothetical protein
MLSIIRSLPDTAFSRKPLLLQVQGQDVSGNPYGAVPCSASIALNSATALVPGNTFTIGVIMHDGTTLSVYMSVEATDDDWYKILRQSLWTGTTDAYYDYVAARIMNHFNLAPFIQVSVTQVSTVYTLKIQAIDSEVVNMITLSTNTAFAITTAATTVDNTPDNFAALVELMVEKTYKSGNFQRVMTSVNRSAFGDCLYQYDLAEAIHSVLMESLAEFPLPAFNNTYNWPANNARRYYIRLGEKSGTPSAIQYWETQGIRTVWRGGNSMESTTDFFLNIADVNPLMCYWSRKIVSKKQPEWMMWCNWLDDERGAILQVKQYSATGTLLNTKVVGNTVWTSRALPLECIFIPAGFTQLNLLSNCAKYTVEVIDQDVYEASPANVVVSMSPLQTFYVKDTYVEDERYLQYFNSFGKIETIRCTGLWQIDQETQRSISVSFGDLESYYGIRHQNDESTERIYTYRTGFMSPDEARILEELFIAGQAWDVSEQYVFALQMTSSKFNVYETWKGLNAYELQFVLRRIERNYKDDKTIATSAGGWANPTDGWWVDKDGAIWRIP